MTTSNQQIHNLPLSKRKRIVGENNFKVCIVTVSYQDLKGLKKTAESVLSQSYPLTWVVVDADSGQETRKYLSSLKHDKHEIIWVSEKDKGIYDGMNKGFNISYGQLYCFLNSADMFAESETVSKVIEDYRIEKWLWMNGLAVRIDESGLPVSVWEYLTPTLGGLALGTRTFCHQSTFYTRDILEKVGPYVLDNLAADHLLNIKAFKLATPKILPLVLTIFQNGGVSSQRPFSASMKDLRNLRLREGLLVCNSRFLDFATSNFVVLAMNIGGLMHRTLSRLIHGFWREKKRDLTGFHTEIQ
jgi:glycosyltransferase involved in cell wall biosynthesis